MNATLKGVKGGGGHRRGNIREKGCSHKEKGLLTPPRGGGGGEKNHVGPDEEDGKKRKTRGRKN